MVYLELFLSFLKIGFTSFGGMSMIPLINDEMVAHGWMSITEVADIVAIAEMTPGPIGINCATFAGLRVAGVLGALMANLGAMGPTFTIGVTVAYFFDKFKHSNGLKHMMKGVRPVCVGIIWAVIVDLIKSNYMAESGLDISNICIGALALYLLFRRKMPIPLVILIGAVLGILSGLFLK